MACPLYAEHCRVHLVLPTTLTGGYDCASSQIRSHEAEKLIPLFKGLQLENGRAGIFTEFFCIPQYSLSHVACCGEWGFLCSFSLCKLGL